MKEKKLVKVKVSDLLEKLSGKEFIVYKENSLYKHRKEGAKYVIKEIKSFLIIIGELIYIKKSLEKNQGYEVSFEKDFSDEYLGAKIYLDVLSTVLAIRLQADSKYEKYFESINTLEDLLKYQKELLEKQQSFLKKLEKNKILIRKEFKDLLDL